MKIPRPVAARREQGASKHMLVPDPVKGPVVRTIFYLRVGEALGYQAIADRLNLDRYPPPEPVNPSRAVGRWTYSSVRDVIVNPKYTGYMGWNRRATTSAGGRNNPPEEWVWSSRPTHEPLVSIEEFTAAQQVAKRREGSRSHPGPNTALGALRSYPLRSYMPFALPAAGGCSVGKPRQDPLRLPSQARLRSPGHPPSIWVHEEPLMEGLSDFFARDIFGPGRLERLQVMLARDDDREIIAYRESVRAIERTLMDLKQRQERLLRSLELVDNLDPLVIRDVNQRVGQLAAQVETKRVQLEHKKAHPPARPCPRLLDDLPAGTTDVGTLLEPVLRKLFDAFRLEMRYDRDTRTSTAR